MWEQAYPQFCRLLSSKPHPAEFREGLTRAAANSTTCDGPIIAALWVARLKFVDQRIHNRPEPMIHYAGLCRDRPGSDFVIPRDRAEAQNSNRALICTRRPVAAPVTNPKPELEMFVLGLLKFGWLKAL